MLSRQEGSGGLQEAVSEVCVSPSHGPLYTVYHDRDPQSGFTLAYDTIKIIYAAYMSAELGNKVELNAF